MLSSTELAELWQRHSAALLLVARGYCRDLPSKDAEDCVQEAFIKLAQQQTSPDSPAAWLMTCVRNTSIDAVRQQQRRTRRESIAAERSSWFLTEELVDSESTQQLQTALAQLDDTTRDIVIGSLWNNMTFRELAITTGLSAATVHRRYETGLNDLRRLMTRPSDTTTFDSCQSEPSS